MAATTPLSVVVSSLVQAAHLDSPSRAPIRSDTGRSGSSLPAWCRMKAQAIVPESRRSGRVDAALGGLNIT